MNATATTPTASKITVTEGFYLNKIGAFKVRRSQSTGRLYALRLNTETNKWDYDKGAIFNLRPETKMTLEQAAAYGRKTGTCMVCGRTLTNKASIEAGIGPICAGGF